MSTSSFLIQNSWLIAAAAVSGGMLLWPVLRSGGAQSIATSQATLLINQQRALVIDIRDEKERAQLGSIPDARFIAVTELKDKAASLSKKKTTPLIVVCTRGQRSKAAVTILKAEGYEQVYSLEGGVLAWQEAGLPLKKARQAA